MPKQQEDQPIQQIDEPKQQEDRPEQQDESKQQEDQQKEDEPKQLEDQPDQQDDQLQPENQSKQQDQLVEDSVVRVLRSPLVVQDLVELKEDLVVMGVIELVNEDSVLISLPGKGVCTLQIDEVSDTLTDLMESHPDQKYYLWKYFRGGSFIVVRIKSIEGSQILVSAKPKNILSTVKNSTGLLKEGVILTCAIKSINESDYALETGLDKVAAFMDKNNYDFEVGKLVNVCVKSVCTVYDNYILMTELISKYSEHDIMDDIVDMDSLVAGMKIKVTAEEELEDGWKLIWTSMGKSYNCFVYKHFIPYNTTFVKNDEYYGFVMYLDNHIYVNLKDQISFLTDEKNIVPKDLNHHVGDIIQCAVVMKVTSLGLDLLLTSHNNVTATRGFLPSCEIKNSGETFQDIKKEFSVGNTIVCRLLRYHPCNQIFICSKRRAVFEEEILCANDAKVGMIVHATVSSEEPMKYHLSIGPNKVRLIMNKHMSQPDTSYKEGDVVQVKIILNYYGMIEVTNRHRLLVSNLLLAGYNNKLETRTDYEGVIFDKDSHFYFVYFNERCAGLAVISPSSSFSVNQIIRCRIISGNPLLERCVARLEAKLYSLILNDNSGQDIAYGCPYKVKIKEVRPDGYVVSLEQNPSITGFIYFNQLSPFKPFAEFQRKNDVFCVDSVLDAIAITNDEPYLFSLNLFTKHAIHSYYSTTYTQCLTDTLPGIIQDICKDTGDLVVRILENRKSYTVRVSSNQRENLDIGQTLIISDILDSCYCTDKRRTKVLILLSDIQCVCDALAEMLSAMEKYYNVEFGYVSIGRSKTNEQKTDTLLELDCQGETIDVDTLEELDYEDDVPYECVLLGYDFDKSIPVASTYNDILNKVIQGRDRDEIVIESCHVAKIIFSCSVYAIGVLEGQLCGKLVYVPTMKHPNFLPMEIDTDIYIEVCIQKIYKNKLIGYEPSILTYWKTGVETFIKKSQTVAENSNTAYPIGYNDYLRKRTALSNQASTSSKKVRKE